MLKIKINGREVNDEEKLEHQIINHEFAVHKCDNKTLLLMNVIAAKFDQLLDDLSDLTLCLTKTRLSSLMRTKLEEACFYAKKTLAENSIALKQMGKNAHLDITSNFISLIISDAQAITSDNLSAIIGGEEIKITPHDLTYKD